MRRCVVVELFGCLVDCRAKFNYLRHLRKNLRKSAGKELLHRLKPTLDKKFSVPADLRRFLRR
jgi:hypothetical protein